MENFKPKLCKIKVYSKFSNCLLAIVLLLSLNLYTSCFNSIQDTNAQTFLLPLTNTATITGTISTQNDFARTAFPENPTGSGYTYYAQVTPVGSTTPTAGSVSSSNDSYTISSLSFNTRYTIEVGIKDSSDNKVLTASHTMTEAEVLTAENPVYQHNFVLAPTKAAKGSINLTIEIPSDSGIINYRTSLDTGPITVTDSSITINKSNINSGSQNLDFYFFDNMYNLIYYFSETVNVYDNMTTREWVRNGGPGSSPYLVEETENIGGVSRTVTKCRITKALVDSFSQTSFYVKNGGSNSNSGSFFSPLETIAGATAKMKDSSKDYTIFVIGTLTGNQLMEATISAKSITLCGYNGLDNTGKPQDILNRDGDPDNPTANGTTLTITTGVSASENGPSIKIKNLGITGGSTTSNGGGLFIGRYSIVEVAHGTEIYSNKTTKNGGGVYTCGKFSMSGGKIYGNSAIGTSTDSSTEGLGGGLYNASGYYGYAFIYGDAVIGERKILSDACANLEGNLYSNFATAKGGGIWSRADLYLGYKNTGTEASPVATETDFSGGVFYNYAHNGGGIYVDALFRMSGATVSHNMAGGGAGGIYVYGKASPNEAIISDANIQKNKGSSGGVVIDTVNVSTIIEIKGNTSISYNEGTFRAGGFSITKGTVKLHDHAVVTGNFSTVAGCAGGVYINSNSKLLMYDDAVIGDDTSSHPDADSYGNKAEYGGGVFLAGGTLALGYDSYTSEAENSTAELRGGILRNYAVTDNENSGGGGIYSNGTNSLLSINSGRINYNKAESRGGGIFDMTTKFIYISGGTLSNNYGYQGGGMFLKSQGLNVEMSDGTISNNYALHNGGGVYFANNPTYTFSGGSVTGNESHNNFGGAFYIGQRQKFIMKGSAFVDYDSSATYKNDIYLSYYASGDRDYGVIFIDSNTIALPEGKTKSAYISLAQTILNIDPPTAKVLVQGDNCTSLTGVYTQFEIVNSVVHYIDSNGYLTTTP